MSSESLNSPQSSEPAQPNPSGTEPEPVAPRAGGSTSRSSARRDRLKLTARLTDRDHTILDWLAEHYLLSTDQLTRAAFGTPRRARKRLAELHDMEAVDWFVDVRTGSRQHLYALGTFGQVLRPTRFHHPDRPDAPAARTNIERTEKIVGSQNLKHLLGVNQFFIDLIGAARTLPGAGLVRWWSEQHTTAAYRGFAAIHPDGHGVWRFGDRSVGFWLEHDRETEQLQIVLDKLTAYARLADSGGPRYPVLLHVPSRAREEHLLDALAHLGPSLPVATAVHGDHPAGLAWTLAGDRTRQRRWLHELPCDHGHPDPVNNPHRWSDPDD